MNKKAYNFSLAISQLDQYALREIFRWSFPMAAIYLEKGEVTNMTGRGSLWTLTWARAISVTWHLKSFPLQFVDTGVNGYGLHES